MAKSTVTYWNPLSFDNANKWQPIEGLEEMAEELTLSIDHESGEYTRLTRFFSRSRHHSIWEQKPCISRRDIYYQWPFV